MYRALVLLCLCCGSLGLNLKAGAANRFSFTSPDGNNRMVLERLASADLDSSASGYIYQSDGVSPPMIVQLVDPPQPLKPFAYDYKTAPWRFEKGEGSEGDSGHYSNNGEKNNNGYRSFDEFHKGLMKKFNKKGDTGFYADNAGHKNAHHDIGSYYGGFDISKKGENGGKHAEESSHRKGHKTTGYHNVYHKDEYKKEHTFYDEAEKSGHHDDFQKGSGSFHAEKGAHNEGGHEESAYAKGDKGKSGFFDKGSEEQEAKGFRESEGEDSHFEKGSDFDNAGGRTFHKKYGFQHSA